MLLRDKLSRSGGGSYRYAVIHLVNYTIYFETHSVGGSEDIFCAWLIPGTVASQLQCTAANEGERRICDDVGEFEAQAVLDHYITTYGLLPEVTDA